MGTALSTQGGKEPESLWTLTHCWEGLRLPPQGPEIQMEIQGVRLSEEAGKISGRNQRGPGHGISRA